MKHQVPDSRYNVLLDAQRDCQTALRKNHVSAAVNVLYHFSDNRTSLWPTVFAWAQPSKKLRSQYKDLAEIIPCEKDKKQIERDIPRTRHWLSRNHKYHSVDVEECKDCSEEPSLTAEEWKNEKKLKRVLLAYVASIEKKCVSAGEKRSVYVQGINGIAFVLLDVLNGNEEDAFTYLRGICTNLLPELFVENLSESSGQSGLTKMSNFYEKLLCDFYPEACKKCKQGGIPAGTLAIKWMLTLFSNISFCGGDDSLMYGTMLAAWDICFLMGRAGVAAVVVTLFGFAAPKLAAIKETPAMVEDIVDVIQASLRQVPDAMLYNKCADLLIQEKIHPMLGELLSSHEKAVRKSQVKLRRKVSYETTYAEVVKTKYTLEKQVCEKSAEESALEEKKSNMKAEETVGPATTNTENNKKDEEMTRAKTKLARSRKRSRSSVKLWKIFSFFGSGDEESATAEEFPGLAHEWIQTWDDGTSEYYYYNIHNFSLMSWSPPPQGYISVDGLLKHANGKLAETSSPKKNIDYDALVSMVS
mmetsp:Transcript_2980/g.3530  ORF Transcript_2980/g.3530 Transcript_2980/m.3530 type:complete len:529 (-) Transcript_2980:1093-2679(-)